MIPWLFRIRRVYGGIAAVVPKLYLAYRAWVWTEFISQLLFMTVLVYFWRAVYAASTGSLGGLTAEQTINYILIAQMLVPMVENRLISEFGFLLREGQIAIDLLRPFDFQMRYYVAELTGFFISVVLKLPLIAIAVVAFGLHLPGNLAQWGAFLLALSLGQAVLFFFDWIFASLAFFSTETWGLGVVRIAVATFFSGALVPLDLMPDWLEVLAQALPFSQAVYEPVAILSGITPLPGIGQVYLIQLAWIAGLGLVSRWFFNLALRQVTVQGG